MFCSVCGCCSIKHAEGLAFQWPFSKFFSRKKGHKRKIYECEFPGQWQCAWMQARQLFPLIISALLHFLHIRSHNTQHFPLFSPAVRPRRRRRLLRARLRASLEGEGRGGQEVVQGKRVRGKIKNTTIVFPQFKSFPFPRIPCEERVAHTLWDPKKARKQFNVSYLFKKPYKNLILFPKHFFKQRSEI